MIQIIDTNQSSVDYATVASKRISLLFIEVGLDAYKADDVLYLIAVEVMKEAQDSWNKEYASYCRRLYDYSVDSVFAITDGNCSATEFVKLYNSVHEVLGNLFHDVRKTERIKTGKEKA